ncbi:twin-arginine translocase subunit TatB [Acinetobacter chinensis]|uniref:Sec-independent protein translocase protein TatB n=1 Tax=Acinetobacter chinensis TaxID=2004650 RepID=A0A3B7M5D4_9GAMM|nr:Sec-independent protein translocase protein TatB [Acinetobacter chinensis]AXY57873.1 twin-arginine translocase subunit TatB [Acinetobacter chinensis]
MLNLGMTEILCFAIIALLVLGPDKLPEAARFAGKWYNKIKRMISNVQNDIDRELRMSELREQMQNEMKRIQELESKMQAQMSQLQQQTVYPAEQPQKQPLYYYPFTPTVKPCLAHRPDIKTFVKQPDTELSDTKQEITPLKVAV